jgi:hypothetical protein
MNVNPQAQTIDALLREPGFAAYQGTAYRSIIDIILDGETLRRTGLRIGELPLDFGLTEDQENGPQEIVAVANVLALLGHPRVTLTKRDRPDFAASLPAGTIYIEHTRAYTGYQQGSEERFYRGIHALQADPDFRAQIGNVTISLTVDRSPIDRTPLEVLEDPEPQGFMSNRDATNMLAEIRELANRGYFQALAGKGKQAVAVDGFSALAKFRATVDVDTPIAEEHIGIHVFTMMWKPGRLSLFSACLERIEEETEKVSKYPIMSDWLVIQAVAPPDVFIFDLAQHEMKTLDPFKKICVLYPHIDGHFYLATYTADADGAIKAEIPELPAFELPYDHALHDWAAAVNDALEPRRIQAWLAAHSDVNVPKMTSSPLQVQWYRKWMGPNPWVMCNTKGDRIQMRFWTNGDWVNRYLEELAPSDINGAADRIWNFLSPDADAGSSA